MGISNDSGQESVEYFRDRALLQELVTKLSDTDANAQTKVDSLKAAISSLGERPETNDIISAIETHLGISDANKLLIELDAYSHELDSNTENGQAEIAKVLTTFIDKIEPSPAMQGADAVTKPVLGAQTLEKIMSEMGNDKVEKKKSKDLTDVNVDLSNFEDTSLITTIEKHFKAGSTDLSAGKIDGDMRGDLESMITGLGAELEKQQKAHEKVTNDLANASDSEVDALLRQQETIDASIQSIDGLSVKIQEEIAASNKINPGIIKSSIENAANRMGNAATANADKAMEESKGAFDVLSQGTKGFGNAVLSADNSISQLTKTFSESNKMMAQTAADTNGYMSNIGGAFRNLASPLALFGSLVAIAGHAITGFQKKLDIGRSYGSAGGGENMVGQLREMHVTSLIDPASLKALGDGMSKNFNVGLGRNQKEMTRVATKQRLSERVMGKEYADNQMEAISDMKTVLAGQSPSGMMDDLTAQTSALAKTMGISNKMALDQIKAIHDNTKMITKGLDGAAAKEIEKTMQGMAAQMKEAGFTQEYITKTLEFASTAAADDNANAQATQNALMIKGMSGAGNKFATDAYAQMDLDQGKAIELMNLRQQLGYEGLNEDQKKQYLEVQKINKQAQELEIGEAMKIANDTKGIYSEAEKAKAKEKVQVLRKKDGFQRSTETINKGGDAINKASKRGKDKFEMNSESAAAQPAIDKLLVSISQQAGNADKSQAELQAILSANLMAANPDKADEIAAAKEKKIKYGMEAEGLTRKEYMSKMSSGQKETLIADKAKDAGMSRGDYLASLSDTQKAALEAEAQSMAMQQLNFDSMTTVLGADITKGVADLESGKKGAKSIGGVNGAELKATLGNDYENKRVKLVSNPVENAGDDIQRNLIKANNAMEEGVMNLVNGAIPLLESAFNLLADNIKIIGMLLAGVFAAKLLWLSKGPLGTLGKGLGLIGKGVLGAANIIGGAAYEVTKGIAKGLIKGTALLGKGLMKAPGLIMGAFKGIGKGGKFLSDSVVTLGKKLNPKKLWDGLKTSMSKLGTVLNPKKLWDGLKNGMSNLRSVLSPKNLWDGLKNGMSNLGTLLNPKNLWSGLKNGMSNLGKTLNPKNLWTGFKSGMTNLGTMLNPKNLWSGFKNGLSNIGGSLKNFGEKLGKFSPSALMAKQKENKELGGNIFTSFEKDEDGNVKTEKVMDKDGKDTGKTRGVKKKGGLFSSIGTGLKGMVGPALLAGVAMKALQGGMEGWGKANAWFQSDLEKMGPLTQEEADALSKSGKAHMENGQWVDEYGNKIERQASLQQKSASAVGGALEALSFGMLDGQHMAHKVSEAFATMGKWMDNIGLTKAFSDLGSAFKEVGDAIWGIIKVVFTALTPVFKVIGDVFSGIFKYVSGAFQVIVGLFTGNMDRVKTGLKTIMDGFVDLFMAPVRFVASLIDSVFGTDIVGSLGTFKKHVVGIFNNIIDFVLSPIETIKKAFSAIGTWLASFAILQPVIDMFNDVGTWLMSFDFIKDISKSFDAMSQWISDFSLVDSAMSMFDSIKTWMANFSLVDSVKSIFSGVSKWLSSFNPFSSSSDEEEGDSGPGILSSVGSMFTSAKDSVGKAMSGIADTLSGPIDAAKGVLMSSLGTIKSGASGILNGLSDLILKPFNTVKAFFAGEISFGDAITSIFTDMVSGVKSIMNGFVDLVSVPFKTAFAFIDSLFGTDLLGSFDGLVTSIKGYFTDIINGVSGIVGGYFSIITAPFNAIYDFFTTDISLMDAMKQMFEGVKNGVISVFNGFLDLVMAPFKLILGFVDSFFGTDLVGSFTSAIAMIKSIFSGLLNAIGPTIDIITTVVTSLFNAVVGAFTRIWDGVSSVVGGLYDVITAPFKAVSAWISGDLSFTEAMSQMFTGMVSGVKTILGGLLSIITTPFNAVLSYIDGIFGTSLSGSFTSIFDNVDRIIDALYDTVIGTFNRVYESISSIVGGLFDIVSAPFKAISAWISGELSFTEAMTQMFTSVKNGVLGVFDGFLELMTAPWNAVITFIDGVFGTDLSATFQSVIDNVSKIFGGFIDIVTSPFKRIMEYFTNPDVSLLDVVKNIFNDIMSSIGTIFGTLKDLVFKPIKDGINWLLGLIPGMGPDSDEEVTTDKLQENVTEAQKTEAKDIQKKIGFETTLGVANEMDKKDLEQKAAGLTTKEIESLIAANNMDNDNIEQLAKIVNDRKAKETEKKTIDPKVTKEITKATTDVVNKKPQTKNEKIFASLTKALANPNLNEKARPGLEKALSGIEKKIAAEKIPKTPVNKVQETAANAIDAQKANAEFKKANPMTALNSTTKTVDFAGEALEVKTYNDPKLEKQSSDLQAEEHKTKKKYNKAKEKQLLSTSGKAFKRNGVVMGAKDAGTVDSKFSREKETQAYDAQKGEAFSNEKSTVVNNIYMSNLKEDAKPIEVDVNALPAKADGGSTGGLGDVFAKMILPDTSKETPVATVGTDEFVVNADMIKTVVKEAGTKTETPPALSPANKKFEEQSKKASLYAPKIGADKTSNTAKLKEDIKETKVLSSATQEAKIKTPEELKAIVDNARAKVREERKSVMNTPNDNVISGTKTTTRDATSADMEKINAARKPTVSSAVEKEEAKTKLKDITSNTIKLEEKIKATKEVPSPNEEFLTQNKKTSLYTPTSIPPKEVKNNATELATELIKSNETNALTSTTDVKEVKTNATDAATTDVKEVKNNATELATEIKKSKEDTSSPVTESGEEQTVKLDAKEMYDLWYKSIKANSADREDLMKGLADNNTDMSEVNGALNRARNKDLPAQKGDKALIAIANKLLISNNISSKKKNPNAEEAEKGVVGAVQKATEKQLVSSDEGKAINADLAKMSAEKKDELSEKLKAVGLTIESVSGMARNVGDGNKQSLASQKGLLEAKNIMAVMQGTKSQKQVDLEENKSKTLKESSKKFVDDKAKAIQTEDLTKTETGAYLVEKDRLAVAELAARKKGDAGKEELKAINEKQIALGKSTKGQLDAEGKLGADAEDIKKKIQIKKDMDSGDKKRVEAAKASTKELVKNDLEASQKKKEIALDDDIIKETKAHRSGKGKEEAEKKIPKDAKKIAKTIDASTTDASEIPTEIPKTAIVMTTDLKKSADGEAQAPKVPESVSGLVTTPKKEAKTSGIDMDAVHANMEKMEQERKDYKSSMRNDRDSLTEKFKGSGDIMEPTTKIKKRKDRAKDFQKYNGKFIDKKNAMNKELNDKHGLTGLNKEIAEKKEKKAEHKNKSKEEQKTRNEKIAALKSRVAAEKQYSGTTVDGKKLTVKELEESKKAEAKENLIGETDTFGETKEFKDAETANDNLKSSIKSGTYKSENEKALEKLQSENGDAKAASKETSSKMGDELALLETKKKKITDSTEFKKDEDTMFADKGLNKSFNDMKLARKALNPDSAKDIKDFEKMDAQTKKDEKAKSTSAIVNPSPIIPTVDKMKIGEVATKPLANASVTKEVLTPGTTNTMNTHNIGSAIPAKPVANVSAVTKAAEAKKMTELQKHSTPGDANETSGSTSNKEVVALLKQIADSNSSISSSTQKQVATTVAGNKIQEKKLKNNIATSDVARQQSITANNN